MNAEEPDFLSYSAFPTAADHGAQAAGSQTWVLSYWEFVNKCVRYI